MSIPPVRQVLNVLELIEYFSRVRTPASLAQIHKDLGWPRSSSYSLLQTLMNAGYLYEPMGKGEFYPTSKWSEISRLIDAGIPLHPGLRHMIARVRDKTNETCSLLAVSGEFAIFEAIEESTELVRFTTSVGHRIPLHATASGRALLSQMSQRDRSALLARVQFEAYTERSPKTVEDVEKEIQVSLARGYFYTVGEHVLGSGGIAIPFYCENKLGTVLVSGPTERIAAAKESILRILKAELETSPANVEKALLR